MRDEGYYLFCSVTLVYLNTMVRLSRARGGRGVLGDLSQALYSSTHRVQPYSSTQVLEYSSSVDSDDGSTSAHCDSGTRVWVLECSPSMHMSLHWDWRDESTKR